MIILENIMQVVNSGVCTGCNACNICEHITFKENQYGFYSPVVDDKCNGCGNCLKECIYDPNRNDEEDE